MLAVGHAATAHARGLHRESQDALRAGLIQCHESGSHLLELFLTHEACRIGAPKLAAEFTVDLLTKADGALAVVVNDWATASMARDAPGLRTVSETLEGLTVLLHAAHASAEAADVHENAGRATQAAAERARARRLLDRCPGADDGFLRRSGDPSTTLTPRELEIARLAAMGLSSAEIAQRLYLSTRTVDTHLGHVYVKLDIRGRTELKDHPHLASRQDSARMERLL
jgi:DNA-binding CsgD family transcriptional regulator